MDTISIQEDRYLLQQDYNYSTIVNDAKEIFLSPKMLVSRKAKCGKISFQIFSAALALAGNYALTPVSLKFGEKNNVVPLGYILAGGNWFSFAAIVAWSLNNIYKQSFNPELSDEHGLCINPPSTGKKIVCFTVAFITGAFSQAAISYIAYAYNKKELAFPILVMISNSWIPIYSVYAALLAVNKSALSAIFKKDILINGLINKKNEFLKLSLDNQINYIDDVKSALNSRITNVNEKMSAFLKKIVLIDSNSKNVCLNGKVTEWAVKTIGAVIAGARVFSLAWITYRGLTDLVNPACGISLGVIVAVTNLYINFVSISNTTYRLFQEASLRLRCKYTPSIIEKYRPASSTLLKIVGIAIASFSWGPTWESIVDNIDNAEFAEALGGIVSYATVAFAINALFNIGEDFLNFRIMKAGSEEEKKVLDFLSRFKAYQERVGKLKPQHKEALTMVLS